MAIRALSGTELSDALGQAFPDVVEEFDSSAAWIRPARIGLVAAFLRDDPELDFQFLNSISAVDYVEYFDLVYHLTSISKQSSALFKARIYGRDGLSIPSVYSVWRGADFQEREIWDLMGIHFEGHPKHEANYALGRVRRPPTAQGFLVAMVKISGACRRVSKIPVVGLTLHLAMVELLTV